MDPIRAHWNPDGPLKCLIKLDSSNHALTNAGNDIFPVRDLGPGFSLSILSEESLRDCREADFPGPDYSQLFFSNSELELEVDRTDPLEPRWTPYEALSSASSGALKCLIKLDSSNHALTNAGNDIFPVRALGLGFSLSILLGESEGMVGGRFSRL